ncbi:MAG: hypothetical protein NVSMB6_01720 [Burkholderiaceae bacterium]
MTGNGTAGATLVTGLHAVTTLIIGLQRRLSQMVRVTGIVGAMATLAFRRGISYINLV